MAAVIDYGVDLSCTTDLDGLLVTVTGSTLMEQVAVRRLFCRPGRLLSNPVDYTIDVRDFLSTGITPSDLPRIRSQVITALTSDQRIFSATCSASFDPNLQILTLVIAGNGASGPFNLTLAVSAVTVEILRP